jgi:hypothetical protein
MKLQNKLTFLFFLFCIPITFSQNKTILKPVKPIAKVTVVLKKETTYYALSKNENTTLTVTGPGKLEILVRARLTDTLTRSTPFTIKYTLDDAKVKTKKIPVLYKSNGAKYKGKIAGSPTKAKKIYINIPPGKHKINFLKSTKQKVHVKFIYIKKPAPNWSELTSSKELENVEIKYLDKNKNFNFKRISNVNKFIINTEGSNELKIIIKAELDNKTQSNSPLRICLSENGKVIATYKISGKKSLTTEYVTEKKLIPGNSNVIYFKVPKGNHNYEIHVCDKNKTSLIRVFQTIIN